MQTYRKIKLTQGDDTLVSSPYNDGGKLIQPPLFKQLVGQSKPSCLVYWQNLGVATIEFASWLFVPAWHLWLSFDKQQCVAVSSLPE